MEKTYKLLALDMDGTLLNEEQKISKENQYWLSKAQEKGITVCLSTGRGMITIRPYLEQLGLTSPVVSVNGSEVWKSPREVLYRHEMQLEWILELRELALKHQVWYWAYSTDGVFNRDEWTDNPAAKTWLKFGYYIDDIDILQEVRETVQRKNLFEITNSHPFNLEMNPPGVNKASGLKSVCELLGLTMDQVIAVGDSLNDVSMIQECGLGVAMGNAQEAVKKLADAVTLKNDEHGVAEVVRRYIFNLS